MAYVTRAGLGPTFLEERMLGVNGEAITGLIVATTTADSEAAPVTNCYWIQETVVSVGSRVFVVGPGSAFTALGYEWPVCAAHRLEGTLNAAHLHERVCEFDMDGGGDVWLQYDPLSASTFRYYLTQVGGAAAWGSTLSTSTNYGLRFQFDGTNAKLWVNGALDISIACSDKPTTFQHLSSVLPASTEQYYCGLGWRASNDEADRPSTTLTIEGSNPKADNETAVYSDEACNGADGAGQWQDWDDDGSDDSNTAIAMCGDAATAGEETSDMDDITMDDPDLVVLRLLGAGIFGSKTCVTYCRIIDGSSNVSEVQNANLGSTAWRGYSRAFPLDANGDPWTKTRVNDTNAGIRALGTPQDENDAWAMNRMETFKLGNDPPAVENRRRALVQVA